MIEFKRKVRNGVLYLEGSDSGREWFHHFLPFSGWRERHAGNILVKWITDERLMIKAVAGHSLGAAVGSYVAKKLHLPLYVYGGKRAPWFGYKKPERAHRHRGDVVPMAPPWRRKWEGQEVFGTRLPFWEAHEPREYRDKIEGDLWDS